MEYVRIDLVSAYSQRLRPFRILSPISLLLLAPFLLLLRTPIAFPVLGRYLRSETGSKEGIPALRTPSSLWESDFPLLPPFRRTRAVEFLMLFNDALVRILRCTSLLFEGSDFCCTAGGVVGL